MPIISVDATNYYDRIHHALVALIFLFIGVQTRKIPVKWAWVSCFHHLLARLKFGLGINAASVDILLEQVDEGGLLC